MFIDLPKSFIFKSRNGRNLAWIRSGTLEISGGTPSEELMYSLTYRFKGKRICSYCGCEIKKGKTTLDHVIPRELGGPTIPNNLVPACRSCNSKKGIMLPWEYSLYTDLEKRKRSEFMEKVMQRHEQIKFESGFKLPYGWVTTARVDDIIVNRIPHDINMEKVDKFYLEYGTIMKPILTDRKHVLFDGLRVWLFAKKKRMRKVPVIIMDNVDIKK